MIDLETLLIAGGLVVLILSNVLTGLLVWFWRARKAERDLEAFDNPPKLTPKKKPSRTIWATVKRTPRIRSELTQKQETALIHTSLDWNVVRQISRLER